MVKEYRISDRAKVVRQDTLNWDLYVYMDSRASGNIKKALAAKGVEPKTGWKLIGHYSTPWQCAMAILNRYPDLVGAGDAEELRDLLDDAVLATNKLSDLIFGPKPQFGKRVDCPCGCGASGITEPSGVNVQDCVRSPGMNFFYWSRQ